MNGEAKSFCSQPWPPSSLKPLLGASYNWVRTRKISLQESRCMEVSDPPSLQVFSVSLVLTPKVPSRVAAPGPSPSRTPLTVHKALLSRRRLTCGRVAFHTRSHDCPTALSLISDLINLYLVLLGLLPHFKGILRWDTGSGREGRLSRARTDAGKS